MGKLLATKAEAEARDKAFKAELDTGSPMGKLLAAKAEAEAKEQAAKVRKFYGEWEPSENRVAPAISLILANDDEKSKEKLMTRLSPAILYSSIADTVQLMNDYILPGFAKSSDDERVKFLAPTPKEIDLKGGAVQADQLLKRNTDPMLRTFSIPTREIVPDDTKMRRYRSSPTHGSQGGGKINKINKNKLKKKTKKRKKSKKCKKSKKYKKRSKKR
jgi:hypothetical protein